MRRGFKEVKIIVEIYANKARICDSGDCKRHWIRIRNHSPFILIYRNRNRRIAYYLPRKSDRAISPCLLEPNAYASCDRRSLVRTACAIVKPKCVTFKVDIVIVIIPSSRWNHQMGCRIQKEKVIVEINAHKVTFDQI